MKRKRTNNQQTISRIVKPVSKTSKNDSYELSDNWLSSISKDLRKKQNEVNSKRLRQIPRFSES